MQALQPDTFNNLTEEHSGTPGTFIILCVVQCIYMCACMQSPGAEIAYNALLAVLQFTVQSWVDVQVQCTPTQCMYNVQCTPTQLYMYVVRTQFVPSFNPQCLSSWTAAFRYCSLISLSLSLSAASYKSDPTHLISRSLNQHCVAFVWRRVGQMLTPADIGGSGLRRILTIVKNWINQWKGLQICL